MCIPTWFFVAYFIGGGLFLAVGIPLLVLFKERLIRAYLDSLRPPGKP